MQAVIRGALCIVLSGSALAQPTPAAGRLHEQVLSSPQWQAFARQVAQNHVSPLQAGQLEAGCRESIQPQATQADDGVIEDCIRAAANQLDPGAIYFSRTEWKTLQDDFKRKFVGIGLELRAHAGRAGLVEIVSAIKGSPAERAGLQAGDVIYSIDGVSTGNLTLTESVRVMRGEAGTDMTLLLYRPGVAGTLKFVVTREPIRVLTTRSKLLSPGLAYLRISQFADRTRNEVIAAVAQLEAGNGGPLSGLVLDLRNCPGGLLSATVGIAALFVPANAEILRVTGQRADTGRVYRASPDDYASKDIAQAPEPAHAPLKAPRLVVLVNGGTATGAEALAQALRERRGAILMGQPTFGRAVVEQVFPLEHGAGMRIATGMMTSPQGLSWQGQALSPDVSASPPAGRAPEFGDLPGDTQLEAAIAQMSRH